MIPRSWYRAQKPLKPRNTKKYEKITKSPPPGSGPENTEKIQKKYENGPKMTVFVFFCIFFVFSGPDPDVGFCFFFFFSYFFFAFPGF